MQGELVKKILGHSRWMNPQPTSSGFEPAVRKHQAIPHGVSSSELRKLLL